MSELRHFLRYQIPGLMFFVHLNVFLRGTGKICSREQLLKLIAPEFLIAVLLGWIIYQIYDTLNPEAHCMKRSIEKVIAWTKIKKKKNKKIIAKHAIQIGLYSNIKQTKEKKDNKSNMKELLNLLSSKFDHWGSRIINAFINLFAFLLYSIFSFITKDTFFCVSALVTFIILSIISSKICTLKKELIYYEGMLIKLKKGEIMKVTVEVNNL